MFSAFGSLFDLAFQSIQRYALGGAAVGVVLGGLCAFALIEIFTRALVKAPQRTYVRMCGTLCCLFCALVLPTFFGAAGFTWGVGHGLGRVVEGPISNTVRQTANGWIRQANGVRIKWLGQWALARRLSETEMTFVTQTAPRWLSDVLLPSDTSASWLTSTGIAVPATVVAVLREGLRETRQHPAFLQPVVDDLRTRSKGPAASRPTMQETLEAMVAPAVFDKAAQGIRATAFSYIKVMLLLALALTAPLIVLLRLLWRSPAKQTVEVA